MRENNVIKSCLEKNVILRAPFSACSDVNGGFVVGSYENDCLFSCDGQHVIVIGSTGSYKTRGIIAPSIHAALLRGNNIISYTTKRDSVEYTLGLAQKLNYRTYFLDFINPENSDHHNPLEIIELNYLNGSSMKKKRALDDLYAFCSSLAKSGNSTTRDIYWYKTARSAILAAAKVILLKLELHLSRQHLTFANIASTINSWLEDKYKAEEMLSKSPFKDDISITNGVGVLTKTGRETAGNQSSAIGASLGDFLDNETFRELTSNTTIEFKAFDERPTIIYITVPANMPEISELTGTLITDFYKTLVNFADSTGGTLKRKTIFVLDEFANIGLDENMVLDLITEGRSRNITSILAFQNTSQLFAKYTANAVKTIIANCMSITLPTNDFEWAKIVQEFSGTRVGEFTGKTYPNVSIEDVTCLFRQQAIVKPINSIPFMTYIPDMTEYNPGYCLEYEMPRVENNVESPKVTNPPCKYEKNNLCDRFFQAFNDHGTFSEYFEFYSDQLLEMKVVWDALITINAIPNYEYKYNENDAKYEINYTSDAFFILLERGFWHHLIAHSSISFHEERWINAFLEANGKRPISNRLSLAKKKNKSDDLFPSEDETKELKQMKELLESLEEDTDEEE